MRDEREAGERVAEGDVERQHAAGAARIERLGERAPERTLVAVEPGDDDRDARVRVRFEPRPRPPRRELELRARVGARDADGLRLTRCRAAARERHAAGGERFEERRLLRRHGVEPVDDEERRLPHPRLFEHVRHDAGEPRAVGEVLAAGAHAVLPRPGRERRRVLAGEHAGQPVGEVPRVGKCPGVARERRGLGDGEERVAGRAAYHVLPEAQLLIGAEEKREAVGERRVERVVVEPLDERGVRQDVGRLPGREARHHLAAVELGRERLRQAPVRRNDRGPARAPERKPGEEFVPRELEESVRHRRGMIGQRAALWASGGFDSGAGSVAKATANASASAVAMATARSPSERWWSISDIP